MRITRGGVATEATGLLESIIGWLLDHEGDLQARNTGTITVNFVASSGQVEVAMLGRDNLKYQPTPKGGSNA